jgi:molybdate transport system substrate-binding protein
MIRFIACLALLFIALPLQATAPSKPAAKPNLTLLTDETMLLPLAQIARAYATDAKTPLTVVVKNVDAAQEQIEQGLEAHIIITANDALIERLTAQGLTDVSSRKSIARTQLALVTASDLSKEANIAKRISFASMLAATPTLPVFINATGTIEGERTSHLLSGHEFSAALAARVDAKPNHDELLASLRDEPSLGLILAADTVNEPDLHVLSLLPAEVSPPVVFDAVVLGSESMRDAKNFTEYLSSRKAQNILARMGYQPPAK